MGFVTVAIARGQDTAPLARQLGAHHYIDSEAQNVAEALQALGGARVILATATSGKAMSAAHRRPGRERQADFRRGVAGAGGGAYRPVHRAAASPCRAGLRAPPRDSQETLAFSALSGVKPMIEEYPLSRAPEADRRMMSGKARFRVVLIPGQ